MHLGCAEAETTPDRDSVGAGGAHGGAGMAGAAEGGSGPQTPATAGAAAAGAADSGTSPAAPDASACPGQNRLAYDAPGCDGSVVARCLFVDEPCASVACNCEGETILGGCGYLYEPFAYRGRCTVGTSDAGLPP
jgi:hypothetical protein